MIVVMTIADGTTDQFGTGIVTRSQPRQEPVQELCSAASLAARKARFLERLSVAVERRFTPIKFATSATIIGAIETGATNLKR